MTFLGEQCRRGKQHGIAQGAGEAGLVAVGEGIAADVDEHEQVGVELCGRGRQARGDAAGADVRIDEDRFLVEQLRHP